MLSDFLTLNPLTKSYFGTPSDRTKMRRITYKKLSIYSDSNSIQPTDVIDRWKRNKTRVKKVQIPKPCFE